MAFYTLMNQFDKPTTVEPEMCKYSLSYAISLWACGVYREKLNKGDQAVMLWFDTPEDVENSAGPRKICPLDKLPPEEDLQELVQICRAYLRPHFVVYATLISTKTVFGTVLPCCADDLFDGPHDPLLTKLREAVGDKWDIPPPRVS